jgi:hypothetical protein
MFFCLHAAEKNISSNLKFSNKFRKKLVPKGSDDGVNIQDYWIFGLCPSSFILKTQRFGNWICFRPQVRGEISTPLGPLETAHHNHWTGYVLNGRVSIPGKGYKFFSSAWVHTGYGAHPATCPICTGALSPEIKRLGRESDHPPPPSTEVKNGGAMQQLPYPYSWRRARLVNHSDNFTLPNSVHTRI